MTRRGLAPEMVLYMTMKADLLVRALRLKKEPKRLQ